jgi:hypothetical protein
LNSSLAPLVPLINYHYLPYFVLLLSVVPAIITSLMQASPVPSLSRVHVPLQFPLHLPVLPTPDHLALAITALYNIIQTLISHSPITSLLNDTPPSLASPPPVNLSGSSKPSYIDHQDYSEFINPYSIRIITDITPIPIPKKKISIKELPNRKCIIPPKIIEWFTKSNQHKTQVTLLIKRRNRDENKNTTKILSRLLVSSM